MIHLYGLFLCPFLESVLSLSLSLLFLLHSFLLSLFLSLLLPLLRSECTSSPSRSASLPVRGTGKTSRCSPPSALRAPPIHRSIPPRFHRSPQDSTPPPSPSAPAADSPAFYWPPSAASPSIFPRIELREGEYLRIKRIERVEHRPD